MRAHDGIGGVGFRNISATTDPFQLVGGVYVVDAIGTWNSGTLTLQRLGPDGNTYITALTALSADGASAATALPAGTYRLAIATATAVFVSVARVPGE